MPEERIVVIGSAHLDIFADYSSRHDGEKDKIGALNYSVGGTAYNIATNLARRYRPTTLVTLLKSESVFADLIETRLEENGIDTTYVERVDALPESGFVGIRRDGELTEAVTASGLTEVPLDRDTVRTAMESASVAVVDCNLSPPQLRLVGTLAEELDVPLFVSGVSERKSLRIEAVDAPVELFSLSRREATFLFDFDPLEAPTATVRDWMEEQSIAHLVVTADEDGCVVFAPDGVHEIRAPAVDEVVSDSGAGDSLVAGLCAEYVERERFEWDALPELVDTWVGTILEQEGATPGSLAREPELSVRDRLDAAVQSNVRGINRLRQRHQWIDLTAAVISLLAAAITFSAVWL